MNIFTTSAIALGLMASQAAALSCIAPDMAREFKKISDSDQTYVVLKGQFSFASRPARGDEQNPQTQTFASTFTGSFLTGDGFTDDVEGVLVTINSNCSASWCGSIMPDADYIAFAERSGTRLTLQANACPSYAFFDPTPDMVQTIEDCIKGKACEPFK